MFSFNDKIRVNTKNRVEILSSASTDLIKCPLKSGTVNHCNDSIAIYFICIINNEKRYCFKCESNKINIDCDLVFEIAISSDENNSNVQSSKSSKKQNAESKQNKKKWFKIKI